MCTQCVPSKASTTLSLDLCPEFMRDGDGAGFISISHFTRVFANFRGYKCWKSKTKMRHVLFQILKIDEKCEMYEILG